MNRRPGGRRPRAIASVAVAAALAGAPLWGLQPAAAVTPEEATAAGYIPNPAPALARITIDEVTPQVLDGAGAGGQVAVGTESGVPTVTVSGTIRNVGDLPLESVDVRLQRGPRAAGAESVREPLVWSEPSFPVRGEFLRVAATLAPGASVPYRVSMPAREVPGSPGPDLQLTEPGVYPLLVNVNGTPEGSSPARLDDARTLLPVLQAPPPASLPGVDDDDEVGAPGPADVPVPSPVPLTVVWPLAAEPTRFAPVPGVHGPEPVVALRDDLLLRELGEEGRLTGLVRAAEEAFGGPGGAELRRALCVAVDPDLLGTVSEIADGRTVVVGEDARQGGPDGRANDSGDGRLADVVDDPSVAGNARRWLDQLRAVAEGGCVVSLPAAQADLDTVAVVGSTELTRAALDRGDSVERILGVAPLGDVAVPASGALNPGSTAALAGAPSTAIVAASATRTDTGLVPPPGMVGLAGSGGINGGGINDGGLDSSGMTSGAGAAGGRALTFSDEVGAALAATGEAPENPVYSDPDTRYWLAADTPAARLQDARATLLAPVIDAAEKAATAAPAGTVEQGGADPAAEGQGVLAVPPQVWTVDGESAGSLLESLGAQLAAGRMRALPLGERLAGPVTVPDGYLASDPTGVADPVGGDPLGVTAGRLRSALEGVGTLNSLVDTSDPNSAGARGHLDPMVGDALRAVSETGRRAGGDGLTSETGTGAAARERSAARLDELERTVSDSLSRVDLLPPGSVFTMASPNSPLLLVTRNALPFPVRVDVAVTAPPGIRVDPVGIVQIPAAGSRTLQVPTQSDSEGGVRHTVAFALLGPDGRPLSQPVELSVQSGGYPVAQAFALAAAALALVLGGRRYLRYRRGILDPADEGHRP